MMTYEFGLGPLVQVAIDKLLFLLHSSKLLLRVLVGRYLINLGEDQGCNLGEDIAIGFSV